MGCKFSGCREDRQTLAWLLVEVTPDVLITFAKEYGYTSDDVRALTPREMQSMMNGPMQRYCKTVDIWDTRSHFAWLAQVIIRIFGEDAPEITELLGDRPDYRDTIDEEAADLSQDDSEWVTWAKSSGHSITRTETGYRIRAQ